MARKNQKAPLNIRFAASVDRGGPEECWDWSLSVDKDGYGQLSMHLDDGHIVTKKTHRIAYEAFIGPIPEGMGVLHACDNRRCCNPAHLFLGTQIDNMADKTAKRRHHFGARHPMAKLTESDVIEIRRQARNGRPHDSIAADFGIVRQTVSDIAARLSWRHLGDADG